MLLKIFIGASIVTAIVSFLFVKIVFLKKNTPGATAPGEEKKKTTSKSSLSKAGGWMGKWFVRLLVIGFALSIVVGIATIGYVIATDGLGNTKAPVVVQPQTLNLQEGVWLGPYNTSRFKLVTISGTTLLNVEHMDGSKQPYEIRHRPEDADKNLDIGSDVRRFWLSSKYGECEVDLTIW